MCKAVRELHEDWKNEGIEIGKTEGIEIGKIEGIEIGKTEGANEYKKETILKLNDKGLTIDEISNLLDINEDYIRKTISKK